MFRRSTFAVAVTAVAVSGCAGNFAKNAQEYRAEVADSTFGSVENFDVPRPFASVVRTFQNKAPECLRIVIRTQSRETIPVRNSRRTVERVVTQKVSYKPTVVSNRGRFELHVQRKNDNMLSASYQPPGGRYILVLDAIPVNRNTTRITLYRGRGTHHDLRSYVRDWAAGTGRGCPDLE